MPQFRNMNELETLMNKAIEKAVENVARRMTDELEKYIKEDYYNSYSPIYYSRSYHLMKSPKYNMLNNNVANVFIDMDAIHYLIGDPKYKTTEYDIVKMASLGYHGSMDILRPGMFWEDFINWCNANVFNLLKEELRKQGLNIK